MGALYMVKRKSAVFEDQQSGVKSRRERRTTRHDGYGFSQRVRKPIEEVFGSVKTADGGGKLRHCRVSRNRPAPLTNSG